MLLALSIFHVSVTCIVMSTVHISIRTIVIKTGLARSVGPIRPRSDAQAIRLRCRTINVSNLIWSDRV